MKRSDITKEEEIYFTMIKIKWIEETSFHSNPTTINANHNALLIIDMGEKALFFIFEDMRKETNFKEYENFCHWYRILRVLTNYEPDYGEHRGYIPEMNKIWLKWAKENNYAD